MWTLSKENEAKIPEWNKRWLEDVILRTKPMTPQDKIEVEIAIREMYNLADLDGDNLDIVFVRSPLEAKIACDARRPRPPSPYTDSHATVNATFNATFNPVDAATDWAARNTHTSGSVYQKVLDFISIYIHRSTYDALEECIKYDAMKDCGNFDSLYCPYLSFIKDVIGFKCKAHKNYKHYETCTKQSSVRYMDKKFCIISDFPTELHNEIREGIFVAHNDKGPSHLWADGSAIWTINGVQVTEQIVLNPETLTIKQIGAEKNEETKRVMIERFGWARYITETNAECLDARINDVDGTSEALMVLKDKSVRLLCACKSTARVYAIRVDNKLKTCQKAQSWMAGKKINVIGVS